MYLHTGVATMLRIALTPAYLGNDPYGVYFNYAIYTGIAVATLP